MTRELTSRKEIRRLEYDFPLQEELAGKKKTYEEVFISPCGMKTQREALRTLKQIQENHPISSGWNCPGGMHEGTFRDPEGLWHAYRHHAKYA